MQTDWELDFEWLRLRHILQDEMRLQTLPDMNAVLLLIGIQEHGFIQSEYTKEEKRDLMHVAVCALLETRGYYRFEGRDADGWPHYRTVESIPSRGVDAQEKLLIECALNYFSALRAEKTLTNS